MEKYKAICFDVDGTLYSTDTLHRIMAPFVLFHPVLTKKYSAMRKTFRACQDDFKSLGLENADIEKKQIAMMVKTYNVTERKAKRLVDRYYSILERIYRKLKRQDEVVKTLQQLKASGCKIGVLSDWPLFNKLEQLGVSEYADLAVSSHDVGLLKPHSACFEYLLNNLKVKPNEMLYVGDSYSKDVIGADSAGIDAVLIGAKDSSGFDKALRVFGNWSEFSKWILSTEEK